MLKIRVISPFRYQYLNGDNKLIKDHYLAAGNYYHLDAKKDRQEVKYILSPNFTFRSYIDVDPSSIPSDLLEELEIEGGLYNDKVQLAKEEEFIPTMIQDNKFIDASESSRVYNDLDEDPKGVQEPSPNPFDQTTPSPSKPKEEEPEEEKEELGLVDKPAESLPDKPEEKEPEEAQDFSSKETEKEEREKALEELHYSKIKDIAELYGIEYTTKQKVIKEILKIEFEDPEEEGSRILDSI
jgi:hypothetical protein